MEQPSKIALFGSIELGKQLILPHQNNAGLFHPILLRLGCQKTTLYSEQARDDGNVFRSNVKIC